MTWRTILGDRTLKGAEAELIRAALGGVVDTVCQNFDDDSWEFGVTLFDQLEPIEKLELLAEVGYALLRDTETVPQLTAINEATVATLFSHVQQSISFEIDEELLCWRPRVLAVFHETGNADELDLQTLDCLDDNEWNSFVEILADRILWDRDFEVVDDLADLPPENASAVRNLMRISEDYFSALPPSPRDSDPERILAVIKELTG
jgi:hypothetical protein